MRTKELYSNYNNHLIMKTTIQLEQETVKRLQQHKMSTRQPYDEIINRLLDEAEDDTLTPEDIEEIKDGLEQIKAGKTISLEDLSKELGVDL